MAQTAYLTNIRLFTNVPLLPDQKDSIYFSSALLQKAWFERKVKRLYANQQYQRVEDNKIRLEGKAVDFIDVNYCSFENLAYGSKIFYAFVLTVDYINDNVFELTIKIDPIQTFIVEIQQGLLNCYVEREHSLTDAVGDNLLEEPISIGEYVINTTQTMLIEDGNGGTTDLSNYVYIVAEALQPDVEPDQESGGEG